MSLMRMSLMAVLGRLSVRRSSRMTGGAPSSRAILRSARSPLPTAFRRLLVACVLAGGAVLAAAGPASAHAELVSSDPAGGAVLGSEPARVTLRFSEEIVLKLSAVTVIGPDGHHLPAGPLTAGPTGEDSLAVDLPPDSGRGTFVIEWEVTAADDGHASSGDVMFAVGAPSPSTGAVAVAAGALGHDRLTSGVYDAAEWFGFAGLALVGGFATVRTRRGARGGSGADGDSGTLASTAAEPDAATGSASVKTGHGLRDGSAAGAAPETLASPGDSVSAAAERDAATGFAATEPTATASPDSPTPADPPGVPPKSPLTWPAALGWIVLLAGTLLQLFTYAPAARGLSPAHVLDRSLLSATLATREGHALMARLVILALAAVVGDTVLRRARGPLIPVLFTLAVAATWGTTGHASTGTQAPLSIASVTVHVAAMALWIGGLFTVALLLLRRGDDVGDGPPLADVVAGFSRLALTAVALIVVTGLYQAWREVGHLGALTGTAYGRLLLAKVAVLLVVIGVARYSRGLVHRWRTGNEAALRSSVLVELAGAAVLLLLAVLLAGNAPAREAGAAARTTAAVGQASSR